MVGPMALTLPSLNGLRAFESAARHLSFTRAATELHVTQTAISHQIRRLEEQLGITLFERRTRELRLTREAAAYLPAVQAAFDELRQATARLQRPARDSLLTVSTTASLAAKWLVTRVAAFQDANPGADVRITNLSAPGRLPARGDRHGGALRTRQLAGPAHALADGRGTCSRCARRRCCAPPSRCASRPTSCIIRCCTPPSRARIGEFVDSPRDRPFRSRHGVAAFDQSFMAVQAAVDGLAWRSAGRASSRRTSPPGRLVVPFELVLPADAGFYVVAPEDTADTPKIALFRDWLLASVTPGAVAPPPDTPPTFR